MADERDRWLGRDVAEQLLRGVPLDAVDADTHALAEKVAEALAALAVTPPPASKKLPGEEAAVAVFRAARTARQDSAAALRPHLAARSVDAGLVRLGRPDADVRQTRWGRPARLALAAVAAAGMIGGVAVAAGAGVLPTPFHHEPAPAVSVSAAVTPPQPLIPPTPGALRTGGVPSPPPGGGSAGDGSSNDEAGVGSDATGRPGSAVDGGAGRTGERWGAVRSSCRDMAEGKAVDAGRMRDLADAAGGSGRVKWFCKGVLDGSDQESGQDGNGKGHNGGGDGNGDGGSSKKANGDGNGGGNGDGDANSGGSSGGSGNVRGGSSGNANGGDDGKGGQADQGGDGVAFTPMAASRALTFPLPRRPLSPADSVLNTADNR